MGRTPDWLCSGQSFGGGLEAFLKGRCPDVLKCVKAFSGENSWSMVGRSVL